MRIAVLGAGDMGVTHAAAYKEIGVEVAAVIGKSKDRAKQLGERLGVPWSTKTKKVLGDPTIDAVDVVLPTALHRKFVIKALEQGKHVLCETPIALRVKDADAMIAAAQAHGRILMVALTMRAVSHYVYVHDAVAARDLGRPLVAYANRLCRPYWSPEKPRDFRLYGEPIIDLMIHDFDYLNWVLGAPRTVVAAGLVGSTGAPEHVFASIAYEGSLALAEGGTMMPQGFPFSTSVRVVCEGGMLEESFHFRGPDEPPHSQLIRYRGADPMEVLDVPGQDPYEEECRYFAQCVEGKADPSRFSAEAAREALRLAIAARNSIRRSRTIRLG